MRIFYTNKKNRLYYKLTKYNYNSLCDSLIDYQNEYIIDTSAMGRVYDMEEQEKIIAVKQRYSEHLQ